MAKKTKTKVKKSKSKPTKANSPKTKKVVQKSKKKLEVKKVKVTSKKVTKAPNTILGRQIPSFKITNSKGEILSLNDLHGKNIVLYFYPKDDTPGCTLEGHEFSALAPKFAEKNTVVFGISKDTVESHHKFICKYNYKVELLSDHQGQFCEFFDVFKEKNMYGRKYMGIERSTFIIDANGKIIKEFRKVSAPGHAQFILEQI